MLLEIVEPLVSAGVGIVGYQYLMNRFTKHKKAKMFLGVKRPNEGGAWPWLYRDGTFHNVAGYQCPKCNHTTTRNDNYARVASNKICNTVDCVDYHEEHFHFQCSHCESKLIMLPADHPHSLEQNRKY
jgi:hypothetical protein